MSLKKINLKDPKVLLAIAVAVVLIYYIYKKYEENKSSSGSGSTTGQAEATTPSPTTEPATEATTPAPEATTPAGGGGSSGSTVSTPTSPAAIGSAVVSALEAAGYTPSSGAATSTSPSGSGGGGSGGTPTSPVLSGSLSSLPIKAQLAAVAKGLATPSQLGKNALTDYLEGITPGNGAAASSKPKSTKLSAQTQREIASAVAAALKKAESAVKATGHATHEAGNAHNGGVRSHATSSSHKVASHPAAKPAPKKTTTKKKK